MSRRQSPLCAICSLAVVVVSAGCVSALHEPPPVAQLTGGASDPAAAGGDVNAILAEADAEFARAPNLGAVARARDLYLQAVAAAEPALAAFLGATRATAWLVEHLDDNRRREELATAGVELAQWCQRRFPDAPECRYRLALAVGQQARERPSTAVDGLDVMVALLEALIAEAPDLDEAGPQRVLALVLLRAPGWPSGPGDLEMGLEHARAAVAAFPGYPPNQLVLGEALLDNDRVAEGRGIFNTALALAENLAAHGNAEATAWIAEAQAALADLD